MNQTQAVKVESESVISVIYEVGVSTFKVLMKICPKKESKVFSS